MPSPAPSYRGSSHATESGPDEGDVPGVRQKQNANKLEVLDRILCRQSSFFN